MPLQSDYTGCLKTDLTLGLPGGAAAEVSKSGVKRGFVDLKLSTTSDDDVSVSTPPPSKAQIVGWPPVRSYRKKPTMTTATKNGKYVKVAVDGAPFLRKVDLETYSSYQQLLSAFEEMFAFLTILSERKMMDSGNGIEYVPTYEDRDGDWMLVGDVPWKMFAESCKRLRLMKSCEAIGLGIS
ncbi:hypothetical protein ACP275_04G104200 [Erythranthe tilingii]